MFQDWPNFDNSKRIPESSTGSQLERGQISLIIRFLFASACSKYAKWSLELAQKILRYLQHTKDLGLTVSPHGDESDLRVYTDAGFAGTDTRSQSGRGCLGRHCHRLEVL